MQFFEINTSLTLQNVTDIITHNKKLVLSADASERINKCRAYLNNKMNKEGAVFYGINTGFGSLCNTQISNEELSQLQENLLLSHACGTGDEVPREIIKLMLLLKIQSLSYGHSGVQLQTVQQLIGFFNSDILPVVYQQGSLGASGDLAPLAHLCLPLLGYGEVWHNSNGEWKKSNTADVLKLYNLNVIKLQSKEGLALINGTQFMLAYAVFNVLLAKRLYRNANQIAAISIDSFDAKLEPFNDLLHQIRAHKGQIETATQIRKLLEGSEIINQPKRHVQDPYAFRCIPQVHGASFDTIEYVASVIEVEMNAVTDNPNIFVEEDIILSGGNFHGQPLALVLDFLAIAVAELGSISERRTYQLIAGIRNLPAFLTPNPGLNSGFMIPQYTAASIVSQNKQLCTPASVDSIVSSNGQEDHVSMGANAATKCFKVCKNTQRILAIELLNATQALEFKRPLKSSSMVEDVFNNFRKIVPFNTADRALYKDIESSILFLEKM
ncbi:MAG: histidine ammonia-lyase [Bacteroidia bacterium]|nr:histidine ammonia-lyase [Bacteroidia bacterium]MCC7533172.1 histidine ammonia-lyase [Bacteroidia bacterium]